MMIDTKIIEDQIAGMVSKGQKLRADEAIFLKAKGVDETIVKTQNDHAKTIEDLETEKKSLKELKAKKMKAVSGASSKIEAKMNEILPLKNALFDCVDGLRMGLKDGEKITLYNGLSGGQRKIFNAALSNVLDTNIIVIEAAEIDPEHMAAVLEDLADSEKQILINTCHPVESVPDAFDVVEL